MSGFASKRANTLPEEDLEEDRTAGPSAPRPSSANPFAAGAVLAGKYLLERELAEGGLGIVMRASHVELDKPVAIKFLKPEILAKPVLVERFRREAQLAASIQSDHVVRVMDVGSVEGGGPYMVMELLEGDDLGTLLLQGPLPVEVAVDYVIQACDALAEAHALGIVHRDLKPENLFVVRRKNTSPIVKILDFGISKTYERKKSLDGAPRVRQMTEAGDRFGTPLYMSPEQLVKTSEVDARTDIWSLGVVLYELVSGALPFDADTVAVYSASVVSMPAIPLRTRLPSAPMGLEAVISKCLEKSPHDRYRNVGELVGELVALVAPNSVARTDRIKRFVLEGGESIRPPRPITQPEVITVGDLPPLSLDALAPAPAPAVESTPPSRSRTWLPYAVGGAFVVLLATGIGLFVATRTGETASPPAPAVPSMPATMAAPPPPPVTALPAPPPAPSAPVAAASSVRREPPPPAPPPAPRPAPKRNDYSEFGDRH